ncbi:MAG: pyruvate ferredoxin oxidoreductase [Clostridium sp.]|nr:pyruvate ferredoxin oxidoreductase [Clostridium sp.]
MSEKRFVSGDEAVALAVRQAKPQVIAAYPITPQTIVVERLADYVEDGTLDTQYMYVESEHSAMSASMGASAMGARTFTATSSQGLLYMAEGLHYASGSRMPIVMMNANRSLAAPWNIYGDQRDSLSQLETGWIQLYAENAQETFDMILQAYKLAEDPDIMLPVMVNLDGFILTHTYEVIDTADQDKVDAFIPYQRYCNAMDMDHPINTCITAGPAYNTEFRYDQHQAALKVLDKLKKVDDEYSALFGRNYGGAVQEYRMEDAEYVIVTLGSVAGTARVVVDKLREKGEKAGLLKIRCMRPFPGREIAEAVNRTKAIAVLEKDISFGYEGGVFTDVNSSLKQMGIDIPTFNFVGGLGGRSISKEDIEGIYRDMMEGRADAGKVKFVNLREEICNA